MNALRDLKNKRYNLIQQSAILQSERFNDKLSAKKSKEVGEKQNEVYKKYKFFDSYIKTLEKIKNNT